jgi:hypothetical protein
MRLRHLCLLVTLCTLLAGMGCCHRHHCLRRRHCETCCTPCCSTCCEASCGYGPVEAIAPPLAPPGHPPVMAAPLPTGVPHP